MTPFQVPMQSICNYRVEHWILIRVFPVIFPLLLCFFISFALADATTDIESLIQNKQCTKAQRLIQAELD